MSEEAKLLELHMQQDTVAFGRLHDALDKQDRKMDSLDVKLDALGSKLSSIALTQATSDTAAKTKAKMSGAALSAITAIATSTITALVVWMITK